MAPWQRTLWIMFFARLVTAVGFSIIFPFLPLYVAALGSSSNFSVEFLAGAVFSAQALTMMIASPFWGSVADRFGRKLMVQRSMFGAAVVMAMMALATTAEQLVLLRAIQGTISGVVSATNALVAGVVPRHRMGYAMGVIQLGTWTGTAIGPFLGGVLADMFGFQYTFYATAGLLFLGGILVLLGVHEEFTPPPPSPASEKKSLWQGWKLILQAQGVGITYLLRFISWMGRSLLLPIAPLLVVSLMPPNADHIATITGVMTGVASATGTISAIYFGRLGDRIGHRQVFIMGATLTACAYLPQSLVQNVWQLIVLQAIAGIGAGSILPTLSALLATYTQPDQAGVVYGLENSITAASRAIAPLLGSSFALWFGLRSTFLLTAALFFLAVLLAFYFLPPQSGQDTRRVPLLQPSSASASSRG